MPSLRDTIRMTDAEQRDYIINSKTLIIVSNGKDGFPHPVPMFYWADERPHVFVETYEKSQKVRNFERDPRAALLIETGKVYEQLKSVIMYCDVNIISDKNVVAEIAGKIGTKNEKPRTGESQEEFLKRMIAVAKKRVVLEFVPRSFVSWDHTKLPAAQ